MRRVRLRRALGVLAAAVLVGAQATIAALAGAGAGGALPPPTPVGPNASPSPFVTSLRTPADTSAEPQISAASAILADLDTGQVLFARSPDAPRPIASVIVCLPGRPLIPVRAAWTTLPGSVASYSVRLLVASSCFHGSLAVPR